MGAGWKPKPTDAPKLLDAVLKIIETDVKRIKKYVRGKGAPILGKDMRDSLCKYATTVAGIKEVKTKDKETEKKRLSSMSTEELFEEWKREKRKKESKFTQAEPISKENPEGLHKESQDG